MRAETCSPLDSQRCAQGLLENIYWIALVLLSSCYFYSPEGISGSRSPVFQARLSACETQG